MIKMQMNKCIPASLTKIATAIYAIEKGNLHEKLVVLKEAIEVEGTRVYLEEGEVGHIRASYSRNVNEFRQ